MKRFRFLYFVLFFSMLVTGYFAFFHVDILKTIASSHENLLRGWAWSSNIGWISLSCVNDGACGSQPNYQVKLEPFLDGKFSGYAWSSNVGWIKFDPAGPYPAAPNYSAQLASSKSANGKVPVKGWIRACASIDAINPPTTCDQDLSINAGGWDGWIKMSGATSNCPNYHADPPQTGPYETCLSSDYKSLDGWAWGGDVVGWIEFNPSTNNIFVPSSSTIFKEVRPR